MRLRRVERQVALLHDRGAVRAHDLVAETLRVPELMRRDLEFHERAQPVHGVAVERNHRRRVVAPTGAETRRIRVRVVRNLVVAGPTNEPHAVLVTGPDLGYAPVTGTGV